MPYCHSKCINTSAVALKGQKMILFRGKEVQQAAAACQQCTILVGDLLMEHGNVANGSLDQHAGLVQLQGTATEVLAVPQNQGEAKQVVLGVLVWCADCCIADHVGNGPTMQVTHACSVLVNALGGMCHLFVVQACYVFRA